MKKKQPVHLDQESKDMLKEKTNQDYNKQKPSPSDPNQTKSQQGVVDAGGENQIKKESVNSDIDMKKSKSESGAKRKRKL